MNRNKTFNRKKIIIIFIACVLMCVFLMGRMVYLMVFCSQYYSDKALDLHQRERVIKAARGRIIDSTGEVLADNRSVCTVSVIHSQIEDPEKIIEVLSKELSMDEKEVEKRVKKVSSIEKIKSNVDKSIGDAIRKYSLKGVKIDEDYKRYYPYNELGSRVLGFTGGDNQGIVGLEVKYDSYMEGKNGSILTITDAAGRELAEEGETRLESVNGNDLHISLDHNIQMFSQQAAEKVRIEKQAEKVSVMIMDVNNGEVLAMVNVPEFDLNRPFTLIEDLDVGQGESEQDRLNIMWRNSCINDTYEPGSTFKVITASAALEENVVGLDEQFTCPGYKLVEDRRIRCHKTSGHGQESFVQAIENSCNPAFIELGLRLGVDNMYKYFQDFGLLKRTGIDLPGEARTIMHDPKKMGQVELATVSFGQSFQITPIQLITTVSSIINGGKRITPHVAVNVTDGTGREVESFKYEKGEQIVTEETSATMRMLLEKVVSEGGGNKAAIEGYAIGGKTATSQTLPRSEHRYISSFVGFAPADAPQIIGMVIIWDPKGVYYGGTIAAPVMKTIFENILPYLNITKT